MARRRDGTKAYGRAATTDEFDLVDLYDLAQNMAALYPEGGEVTVADLVAKGAVRDSCLVKVLGTGDLAVALHVTADKVSAAAKEKIEAAGGSVTLVE